MQEELIRFETAKLAKEKEFNEYCRNAFDENGKPSSFSDHTYAKKRNKNSDIHLIDTNTEEFEYPDLICTRPTQSLLQKWLREIHNIDIRIFRNYQYMVKYKKNESEYYDDVKYSTYEEALEAGLIESLKLI